MGGIVSSGNELSRRQIVMSAVGAAAAGAAGASLLAESGTAPAHAAELATTVESGAIAPAVVSLADAPTIELNAAEGNDFRVTISGNRTVSTPASPADGQKITLQVTQGSGGPFTLAWDTGYVFSAGLPQPTLSTTAGQTDLLGFLYNAAMGKWLLAAFVSGFAPPPAPAQQTGTYRLFPGTDGPASPVSYNGPFTCGVVFSVTSGACWLDGYWWWVCGSGQSTSPQRFALWQAYNGSQGTLVPDSQVTSGSLTAGHWNFVPLSSPLPLAIGAVYVAATGFTGSFPDTGNQFGSGDPYSGGIVNGPLTAYSDSTGSLPSPFNTAQGVFSVASDNPAASIPIFGSSACNFWMDVQADTNPPAGTSYRMWPNYPTLPGSLDSDVAAYTLATEFGLSVPCALNNIWFYSASGATVLPTRCAIWDVSSQTEVTGTDNSSPAWSGVAGSGWVACSYSGVPLPAGDYKVAVYYGGGSPWYQATGGYWATGGAGGKGITAGPLTAPATSAAASPGQCTYQPGSWAYPDSYSPGGNGENFWVDVEVTPGF
jgi:hypothetical protein